ncbi:MAG TPA: type II secretion system F family protein [Bryobacteraceae bacterium]|nr:type II secretion system F family protein [Bryobacteraceae bacterium]
MLILSILAFFAVIFLLASITVTVAWMGFLKTTAEESDAARRDLQVSGETSGETSGDDRPAPGFDESPLFRNERLSSLNFWDAVLTRFDFIEILRERIAQAELNWSVGRVTLAMLLSGTVALLVLAKLVAPWAALAGAALVAFAPYGYVLRARNKRFQKFSENFPDVLDSLSRALRAGYPLSAAMEMISTETLPPVSTEMRKTSAEANLGMGWPQALDNLSRRVPLLEVNLFIAAVQLHARTGGKLSEVLGGLAENMREAIALQGEVRSLAAHGKLTGVILTILPIGIAIMMMIVSPGYMQVLFHYPYGKTLITAAAVCLVLAHLVIRKIVDIKI